jgi:surfactin synthase thioesterase subunit
MVPTIFHRRESLPLTDNGKINKKALLALAQELDAVAPDFQLPTTEAERRLAETWAGVLGISTAEIGRNDNFFDRGGTSLSAVELVIALNSAISLKDVTGYPTLAEQAQLMEGRSSQQTGLLQLLSETDQRQAGTLVCFPYAGGNAINFQAMARAMRGSGFAVHAIELPGHDLTTESEPFAPIDHVVERVVAEIASGDPTRLLLWGHSSGAALAVETARKLQERSVDVERVFLGAQLLGDVAARRAHINELSARSDTEIAADLSSISGYTELGELDAQHAKHVGAAYRHDCLLAHRYLLAVLDAPPSAKLTVPVTVVVAADDPRTSGWPALYGDWQLVAEHVDVEELNDGGHYFLRTRPSEAAEVVLRLAGSLATR